MTGELILTSVTYDVGRIAINDAFSGTATFNNVQATGYISGTTISGGTLYSGSTNLYSIFSTSNDITRVQPGSNINTGGTGNLPTISLVASPSVNAIFVSGASQLNTTTTASLSGGTISAATFYSGSTLLSQVISSLSGSSGNLFSASTGSNSIIANNNTGNLASGSTSIALGSGCIAGGPLSIAIGNGNQSLGTNTDTVIGGTGNVSNSFTDSFIAGGASNWLGFSESASGIFAGTSNSGNGMSDSAIIAGTSNINGGSSNAIIGGSNNTNSADYSAIIGGAGNTIALNEVGAIILGMSGFTSASALTTHMTRTYVKEYLDLNPVTSVPTAKAGRMFFSGGTLNRVLLFTGNTANDYMTL